MDAAEVVATTLREHKPQMVRSATKSRPGFVFWDDGCSGCDWTGADHDAHVAEAVVEALEAAGCAVVQLPEPYPDDTIYPYWVPERGQHVGIQEPGVVSVEMSARWRTMNTATAHATGVAFLAASAAAAALDGRSFPCPVDACPRRFVDYDVLNEHSRKAHVEATGLRYPGVDHAGDFTWHQVSP